MKTKEALAVAAGALALGAVTGVLVMPTTFWSTRQQFYVGVLKAIGMDRGAVALPDRPVRPGQGVPMQRGGVWDAGDALCSREDRLLQLR